MPKSKKTALYFYCQEQMRKQHRSMSMKDAIDEFYTKWAPSFRRSWWRLI